MQSKQEIVDALNSTGEEMEKLLAKAGSIRDQRVGNGIYLRGLVEYSNVCSKNCLYCGIRSEGESKRYTLSEGEVLEAAKFAYENRYGSLVIQSGENSSKAFVDTIERVVGEIKSLSDGELGITLSLGEQSIETYNRWFEAGAHRYLIRVETSDRELYKRIHPNDEIHDFDRRVKALHDLRRAGYQVGTGVMIGLPYQTRESLAGDLLFMKELDIDMCGMGPYIVSRGTPLAEKVHELGDGEDAGAPLTKEQLEGGVIHSKMQRLKLTYKMIALLRLLMPDINIAATTALQAIAPEARIKAVNSGANVVMPNITPPQVRADYSLYDNKPLMVDSHILEKNIRYGEWGDSIHFKKRVQE